jgi:hypothetical protein
MTKLMSLQPTVRTRTSENCIEKYQPINKLEKYENGDLLADSHNIFNRWKNYFSQLLNVHNFSNVRQI